jgi:hypothetical protein
MDERVGDRELDNPNDTLGKDDLDSNSSPDESRAGEDAEDF